MYVRDMNARAVQETIDELKAEARLARAKSDLRRADVLETAAKRVADEFAREQARPTAMRFDRAS